MRGGATPRDTGRPRALTEGDGGVRATVERTGPGKRVEFKQVLTVVRDGLRGSGRRKEIKLFGSDLKALETYASVLARKFQSIEGLDEF